MVIDLRGWGRRGAAGLLLLAGALSALCGVKEVARTVLKEVTPQAAPPIRRVARPDRSVALTFDAVWGTEEAEAIVAALARHRVPATFFASGVWLSQCKDLARRMAEQGFEFGNATVSYPYLDALTPDSQREEIRQAHLMLERLTGQKITLFRPPHGVSTPPAELAARELGYRTVLWSVDALNGRNPPPELLASLVEQQLSPGAIIRFTTAGRTTAQAIPLVAGLLARRGYRAVTVSELLLADNYYVEPETGEQRPLPGARAGERPVLSEWWARRRHGAKRGVTLDGRSVGGLLPAEVRRLAVELARGLDREPRDAQWDDREGRVRPETAGRRVDVEATVRAVLEAPPGAAVRPVVREVRPRVVGAMFSPVYRGEADRPRAALMFNVAWGNEFLPPLLDRLEEAGVRATFLVLGEWAKRFPDLLAEIGRRGHCVGSHGYLHVDLREQSAEAVRDSLRRTERAVRAAGVELSPLFAPPNGAVNPAMVRAAAQEGYWTIMWTADTIDWQRPKPEVIRERVRRKLVPGALILLHPTEPTVAALPGLIADLRAAGYALVTVPELLPLSPTASR